MGHSALNVERGVDSCQKGSEYAVGSADGEHHFERLSRADRLAPALEDSREIPRLMHRLPAPALHLGRRGPGVLVPARVVPEDVAGGIRDPTKRRYVVGEEAKQSIIDRLAEEVVVSSHPAGHHDFCSLGFSILRYCTR